MKQIKLNKIHYSSNLLYNFKQYKKYIVFHKTKENCHAGKRVNVKGLSWTLKTNYNGNTKIKITEVCQVKHLYTTPSKIAMSTYPGHPNNKPKQIPNKERVDTI